MITSESQNPFLPFKSLLTDLKNNPFLTASNEDDSQKENISFNV